MRRCKHLIPYCILLFMLFFVYACSSNKTELQILSWQNTLLDEPDIWKQLQAQNVKRIYQYPTQYSSIEKVRKLLSLSEQYEIEVYAMEGEPDWISDKDGESIKAAIDAIYALDQSLGSHTFKGILLDVEPYQYENYKENPDHWMSAYEHVMKIAYTYAKTYGYEVVLCIPYSFDNRGFYDTLEELMLYCDEVAIMNYQKKEEWKQIEHEVALAKQYKKPITVLYEVQPSGSYGLNDENTYHKDGIPAIYESFQEIKKQANGYDIQLGIHELDSYLSLLETQK